MDKVMMLCLIPTLCYSSGFQDFAKVRNLYIETEKRVLVNRSYYLNNQTDAQYDVNLGLDLDLPRSFYYNNKVVSTVDSTQFRFIGLNFEIGVEPIKHIQVYMRHFSGHAMDDHFEHNFPQDNTIGIRWNFIGDGK